jgi:hypothetical protein
MRVLITNLTLQGRTGTETATRDLALGLKNTGHIPLVYSPLHGGIADELRQAGITVVDSLDALTGTPDIIHGHHHVETHQALARFQNTPAIFVMHDAQAWHDVPPLSPQIHRYVAVDLCCMERLERYSIPREKLRTIFNSFDPRRFSMREKLPEKPSRALVFSNYASRGTFLDPIAWACTELGIPLDVIGAGSGCLQTEPEKILHDYDLVFGIARCAIEAMASGAAVILCGTAGLGQMVTMQNVEKFRPWNFGRRLLSRPVEQKLLVEEIQGFDPQDALDVSHHMHMHATLDCAAGEYIALYREVLAAPTHPASVTFAEVLQRSAEQMKKFEDQCLALTEQRCCTRLPSNIGADLSLRILECPAHASTAFAVKVELENQSAKTFGSYPPFPVHFSYRWFSKNGDAIVGEGRRTELPCRIGPGEKISCGVLVEPPETGGKHQLRITLVQEQVMWFDQIEPPRAAECAVEVSSGGHGDVETAA